MAKWEPDDNQIAALCHVHQKPFSALFLDPGMGKTSTMLALTKILNTKIKGVLLIAPLTVCYDTWPGEIEKWDNFKNITYTILHEDQKMSLWDEQKRLYIINPEGLAWLYYKLLDGLRAGEVCPFDTLVIDESTKFKSHDAKRFGLIVDMLPLFKRRHILTGTPAPKSYVDLWSQIFVLDQGKSLGKNYYRFRQKYFQTDDWNKHDWKIKDGADKEIQKAISHLVLDMSNEKIKLPELVEIDLQIILPKSVMEQYNKLKSSLYLAVDDDTISADTMAQLSLKCYQFANGNVYEDLPDDLDEDALREFKKTRKTIHIHNKKIEALRNLVDELNGKPLLVAYYFKHDLDSILKEFPGTPYIGSGVSASKVREIVKNWNAGKYPLLLGHPKSMAHGLNMQESCNNICFYSCVNSLEDYIQFVARIWRKGVKGQHVRVYRMIAKNTIDEIMIRRLKERGGQQKSLREALRYYRINSDELAQ